MLAVTSRSASDWCFNATTLWHIDAVEWAPSTASLAATTQSGARFRFCPRMQTFAKMSGVTAKGQKWKSPHLIDLAGGNVAPRLIGVYSQDRPASPAERASSGRAEYDCLPWNEYDGIRQRFDGNEKPAR